MSITKVCVYVVALYFFCSSSLIPRVANSASMSGGAYTVDGGIMSSYGDTVTGGPYIVSGNASVASSNNLVVAQPPVTSGGGGGGGGSSTRSNIPNLYTSVFHTGTVITFTYPRALVMDNIPKVNQFVVQTPQKTIIPIKSIAIDGNKLKIHLAVQQKHDSPLIVSYILKTVPITISSPNQTEALFWSRVVPVENVSKPNCSIDYERLIKLGLRGLDVKQVQVCMNSLGYTTGVTDGIYGPNTYKGITAFQKKNGLKFIDGIVGPETSRYLNALGVSLIPVATPVTKPTQAGGTSSECPFFAHNASLYNSNSEIVKIQVFLNAELGTKLPTTGYFGERTQKAVMVFQERHKEAIMGESGSRVPTGLWYEATRSVANKIKGC